MNTDQFLSTLRSLMKYAGASLVTHGYMTAGNVEFYIGMIVALAGYVCSHMAHGDDKDGPKQGQLNLSLILLCVFVAAFSGCTTTNAYKAESATAITVEQAMHGWNDYVGQFHPSIADEQKVKSIFEKYHALELTAIDATAAYAQSHTPGNKATMQAATAALAASLADLVATIQTFGVKLTN